MLPPRRYTADSGCSGAEHQPEACKIQVQGFTVGAYSRIQLDGRRTLVANVGLVRLVRLIERTFLHNAGVSRFRTFNLEEAPLRILFIASFHPLYPRTVCILSFEGLRWPWFGRIATISFGGMVEGLRCNTA